MVQKTIKKVRKTTKDGLKNLCGDNIGILRCSAVPQISQQKLSERLQAMGIDLTEKDIQRIEMGQQFVSDIELEGLAKALGVTLSELVKRPE